MKNKEKKPKLYYCPMCKTWGLPPWIHLCLDYDDGVIKAQWWADKEYGEKFAR